MFPPSRREAFLTSFLLAHCGGGQDKPGCLGPSAKLPRHFFCSHSNLVFFPLSRSPASSVDVSHRLCTPCSNPLDSLASSPPLPLRRLYLRAGDFHSNGRRRWKQPSRDTACRGYLNRVEKNSYAKNSNALRSAMAR